MKGYWAHSPKFFKTNEQEIKNLSLHWEYTPRLFSYNLQVLRHVYPDLSIVDFTIRKVPEKKSKWDNARLLCIKTKDGEFMAKRINKSQFLPIMFEDMLDFING